MAMLFLTSEARHIKKTRARYNARMPSLIEKIMQGLPASGLGGGNMCWAEYGDDWFCADDEVCCPDNYSGCAPSCKECSSQECLH